MANQKISQLPAATAPTATDLIPVVQAGANATLTPPALFGAGPSGNLVAYSAGSLLGNSNIVATAVVTSTAYNLFALGGANGGLIVRQQGGVAGTNEVQISNNGTNTLILDQKGSNSGVVLGGSNTQAIRVQSNAIIMASGTTLYYAASGFGTLDCSIARLAAGVLGPDVGSWYQNTPGEACLASPFTKNNATLGVTLLSFTVKAGRSYRMEGILQVSNTTAAEGVQIAFDGGTATATTFFMSASAVGSVVAGTVVSTTLAGTITYTTVTGTDYVILRGFLKVNAAGTLIMRAAEATTATGTLTIGAGSWIALYDTVPL